MSVHHAKSALVAIAASLAAGGSCTAAQETSLPVASQCPQALIRGTSASDSRLDAIGSVGQRDSDGVFHAECSGTLIAPNRVLTAKHCTFRSGSAASGPESALYFAIGPDANAPIALARVVEMDLPTVASGGVAELGSDIAVLRTESAVQGVEPIALSELLASSLIGSEVTTYGYGTDSQGCNRDASFRPLRRRGVQTLRAVEGNIFDFIYGDYATYLDQALPSHGAEAARTRYQNGVLEEGYEAWIEKGSDGSQACFGDSGGPVTVEVDGVLQIIGVISWTWPSAEQLCDYGAVVAVFGPAAWPILTAD